MSIVTKVRLMEFNLQWCAKETTKTHTKGRSILFNHFIDMKATVNLSISCRKKRVLMENFNKNTFFLHEMDKLTVVLMSIK